MAADDDDPFDRYYAAGLSDEEARAVADFAAELGAADPLAIHVSVPSGAAQAVLGALDRLVDEAGEGEDDHAEAAGAAVVRLPRTYGMVVKRADLVVINGIGEHIHPQLRLLVRPMTERRQ